MKNCKICGQQCKENAKYCTKCSRILTNNQKLVSLWKKKYGFKLCPICFKACLGTFCRKCVKKLNEPKILLNKKSVMDKKEYLDLSYTYTIKDPVFFRKKKQDFVSFKVIEVELKKGKILTQNLEILYKQGVPKRNRFMSKERYFQEILLPIFRAKYERWRDNQIRFMVDVAVEGMRMGAF
ncbi:MAG: hypothetical protein DLD55_01780 [candidate division SR1 bacterium]|nr:MAG: hypothetical protein DLD55_01780 [candidate division SR1 bacterium]